MRCRDGIQPQSDESVSHCKQCVIEACGPTFLHPGARKMIFMKVLAWWPPASWVHTSYIQIFYMKSQAQQFCESGTSLKISGNWSQQKSVLHNFKSPSHQDSSLTGAFNTDMCTWGVSMKLIWVNDVMAISSAFPCLCEKSRLWSMFQKLGGNVVTSLAGQEWRYRQGRQFTSGPIQVHSDSDSSASIR